MHSFTFDALVLLAFTASSTIAAPHRSGSAGRNMCNSNQQASGTAATAPKAIYLLTNEAENAVVALPVGQDGTLSKGTTTKTQGKGSISIDAATGNPALPDPLVGQSALTVVGNNLFAVNAGSDTVTMMSIDPTDPTKLCVVGQPAALPGNFPNTVAASAKNNLVCVGTTGAKAGISCAPFSSSQGIGKMDGLREFDIGQSTPPKGPTNTVSHTFFSNDESMLFTTVKGDPAVNNTGFLSVLNMENGNGQQASVSQQDVRSSPNGTAVLFGSAPIPNSDSLFVTDASFGAAVLSVGNDGQASLVGSQAIDGQKATCWATISAKTGSAFVTDVGVNGVVEMSLKDASIISQLDLSKNGKTGLIDLKSGGDFVYILSPGDGSAPAAVTVLDVSGGQGSMNVKQLFGLDGMATNSAQGMAVLV